VCRVTGGEHHSIAVGELLGPIDVRGHPWGPLPRALYLGKVRRTVRADRAPRPHVAPHRLHPQRPAEPNLFDVG
jgi:hypothetical protein